jgi:cell division transport system permease protein
VTQAETYERLRELWKESPDFVAAIDADSVPASYRVRLRDRARFADFSRDYVNKAGVGDIIGRVCPASAPIGGGVL